VLGLFLRGVNPSNEIALSRYQSPSFRKAKGTNLALLKQDSKTTQGYLYHTERFLRYTPRNPKATQTYYLKRITLIAKGKEQVKNRLKGTIEFSSKPLPTSRLLVFLSLAEKDQQSKIFANFSGNHAHQVFSDGMKQKVGLLV
jgi:hypothetical protein